MSWRIDAASLANTSCAGSPNGSYVYVEVWKLFRNASSSNATAGANTTMAVRGANGTRLNASDSSSPFTTWQPELGDDGSSSDIYLLAALGQDPDVLMGASGSIHFMPALNAQERAPGEGTYIDEAGTLYQRPYQRLLLPLGVQPPANTSSIVGADGRMLVPVDGLLGVSGRRLLGASPAPREGGGGGGGGNATASTAATATKRGGSGGNAKASAAADPNAWHLQLLNMNQAGEALAGYALSATCLLPRGNVDALPCPSPEPGGLQCAGRGVCATQAGGSSADLRSRYCECEPGWGGSACQLPIAPLALSDEWSELTLQPGAWAHYEVQLPPVSSSPADLELLVSLERRAGPGMGGDPLLFLKPFDTPDGSEPSIHAQGSDLAEYADLRSFVLQQSRHFLLRRLRGPPSRIPRRWYVSVYNNNHNNHLRLDQPASLRLRAQLWDLASSEFVCPLDCSGRGACMDPYDGAAATGLGLGRDPDPAASSSSAALLSDPQGQGFQCLCDRWVGLCAFGGCVRAPMCPRASRAWCIWLGASAALVLCLLQQHFCRHTVLTNCLPAAGWCTCDAQGLWRCAVRRAADQPQRWQHHAGHCPH